MCNFIFSLNFYISVLITNESFYLQFSLETVQARLKIYEIQNSILDKLR